MTRTSPLILTRSRIVNEMIIQNIGQVSADPSHWTPITVMRKIEVVTWNATQQVVQGRIHGNADLHLLDHPAKLVAGGWSRKPRLTASMA